MAKKDKRTFPGQSLPDKNRRINRVLLITVTACVCLAAIILVFIYVFPEKPVSKKTPPSSAATIFSPKPFKSQGRLAFLKSPDDTVATIDIETADNPDEKAAGLMTRNQLAESEGMLFVFGDESIRSFWMKNTILPLDMIFVDSRHRIVTILKNTTPFDQSHYSSDAPAQYVIEVSAGFCDRHKIAIGDSTTWTIYQTFGR